MVNKGSLMHSPDNGLTTGEGVRVTTRSAALQAQERVSSGLCQHIVSASSVLRQCLISVFVSGFSST